MTQRRGIESCIVVGAGVAGMVAARLHEDHGVRVITLEKSRGLGGRLATRRIEDATFDHGGQYFTVCDPRFGQLVENWQAAGVVRHWRRGAIEGKPEPAWLYGSKGMTGIAKHLAKDLDVRRGKGVCKLWLTKNRWKVKTHEGVELTTQAVILTPPVPQSLALLDGSNVTLHQQERGKLEKLRYKECISAICLLEGPSRVPWPGGLQLDGEPIQWVADNHLKGISRKEGAVTIHAGHEFSRQHWDMDTKETGQELIEAARYWLGSKVRTFQVHRWRYSRPVDQFPAICLSVDSPLPLILAGDAFGGPRVEGAALSGFAAARQLLY